MNTARSLIGNLDIGRFDVDKTQPRPPGSPTTHAPDFDRQDQVEKVQDALVPGETLEAVFDLKGTGTGFLGITTKRLIFYDKVFLRKMKAVVSLPYSRIATVAAQDQSGIFSGRGFFASSTLIVVSNHGEHEFEFRGADKAHLAHNLIMSHLL